jgi:hypothetical protein
MLYLVLGGAALALYVWATRRKVPVLKQREWQVVGGVLALVAFTVAAWAGVRGSWGAAIVLVVIGLWLATSARKTTLAKPRPPVTTRMSADEARRILGVAGDASRDDIQAAYTRLMRAVHPDKGGTAGLAAQLNAARDRLLAK